MNTEKKILERKLGTEVSAGGSPPSYKNRNFDHGATRRRGAELSDAEILIFMTQDALPADRNLVGNLVQAVAGNEKTGAAYARQLPKNDCGFLEKYTRSFNYPEQSCLKTEKDVETRGIKTYFCSKCLCSIRSQDLQ